MNQAILVTISLLIAGVFVIVTPSAFAQPCVNNGTNLLGPNAGKQILNQENQCTGTGKNVNRPPSIISAPIANAGISQTVASGALVTLNGAGSTGSVSILNGVQTQATIISYAWTQVSGTTVSLNGANTITPTFVAPTIGNTTSILVFSLTVTDSAGLVSSPSTVSVTVT